MHSIDNERFMGVWILSYTFACVNMACIAFLLGFTLCVDLPRRRAPATWKTALSTSHSLLLSLQISAMGCNLCKGRFLQSGNAHFRIAYTFWYGISEVLYLFFSWARSSEILKIQFTPRMYRIFLSLLYSTPFTCILPAIVQVCALPLTPVQSEKYYNMSNFLCGGFVTAMDTFFAVAFYSYLIKYATSTPDDMPCTENNNGARLQIIARYGLISSCFCFVALIGFVVLMSAFVIDPSLSNPSIRTAYMFGNITVDVGSFLAVTTPVIMKIRLHQVSMSGDGLCKAESKRDGSANAMDSGTAGIVQRTQLSSKWINVNPS